MSLRNLWFGAALLATTSVGAQTPVSEPELEAEMAARWESDFEIVKGMTSYDRVEFIQQNLETMTLDEQRAYKQAFKARKAAYMEAVAAGFEPMPQVKSDAAGKPEANTDRPKIPGTQIQYDDGTVSAGGIGTASELLGNRFDSALNPPGTSCCFPVESSGSITMITFDMVNTFFGSVVFSLYSNIVGTMADQVTSMARPGIMTGLNTLSVMSPTTMVAYSNGAFIAGIWQFDPTMTGLGVATGTTGGQGFHAVNMNDGAVGTGLDTLTSGGMGLNAVFRVSGNVATPVELQNFSVD